MEKKAALEQIDFLKELVQKTSLTSYESYPFLLIWGLVWILGYTMTIWLPDVTWMYLGGIGGIVSMVTGRYFHWNPNSDMRLLKKLSYQAVVVVIIFFFYPLLFEGGMRLEATFTFWPILIGTLYILYGIMIGLEMVILGVAIVAAGIVGMFIEGNLQNIWYAMVCGGILFGTGLYFRRKVK